MDHMAELSKPSPSTLRRRRPSMRALHAPVVQRIWRGGRVCTRVSTAAEAGVPRMPTTVYAANGGGVSKSTDGGTTWSTASDGLPGNPVFQLAIDPQTPTTLYASGGVDGAFKSVDGGRTWSRIGNESTDIRVVLAIDPQTPTTLSAGARSGSGLFKSTDGGDSWFALN